ncbi:hypothetical protein HaLaN_13236 [Haematococcus lacustris]|uniref:Uncharacterized protein n=1 Tax=Haematococcus lacustris TaxID=44745 RepID=A0A699Z3V1_HAELA|nr:hypothetical protein HaLaN_13236 [Haematococcus lacustris]
MSWVMLTEVTAAAADTATLAAAGLLASDAAALKALALRVYSTDPTLSESRHLPEPAPQQGPPGQAA